MKTYPLLIDGELVVTATTDAVFDPATEQVVGHASRADAALIDRAVSAALRAFPAWSADTALRQRTLRAAAVVLREHASEISRLITLEQGRPLKNTAAEPLNAAATLEQFADYAPEAAAPFEEGGKQIRIIRKPFGVVAAITPWNVPVGILFTKITPALRAGNTVVAKPSEHTPLSTLRIAELLRDVFPPGVLNIVAGAGEVGAAIARDPRVGKITFTGSVATGRRIFETAARDIKRLTLELGGNDAAIVLDDVDPETVAEKLFWVAFRNSGQVCFAVKRLFVQRGVFDAIVDALARRAERTRVGNGLEADTELGPLTSRTQYERVAELVDDARAHGARIHSGGAPLEGPGWFYPPTIVSGIGPGSRLVDEEQFGPALPVIPFDDVEEAIALANATPFGLGASIWTGNVERALPLIEQLDAGMVWINRHAEGSKQAPKGGHKSSGLGVEGGGAWGYEHYVQVQVVSVAAP
ncbi:aldehyde dehydrogenase [Panacagrimonas perspica]|nr:aldehyde dehydrogenase family protein [Panacagrimonas perspica]THD03076.1 aldehyde dehydrogenase [Panacagrimonas perspica]